MHFAFNQIITSSQNFILLFFYQPKIVMRNCSKVKRVDQYSPITPKNLFPRTALKTTHQLKNLHGILLLSAAQWTIACSYIQSQPKLKLSYANCKLPNNHSKFSQHYSVSQVCYSIESKGLIKSTWQGRDGEKAYEDHILLFSQGSLHPSPCVVMFVKFSSSHPKVLVLD